MQKICIFLVALFVATSVLHATNAPITRVLQDQGSSIVVEFELRDYAVEPIEVDGQACSRITLPGEPTFLEKGLPELPTVARSIIIPDDGQMAYRVLDIEYETRPVTTVVPSKGNLYRNVDPATVPYVFDRFYERDAWWPRENVVVYEPFILRDYRGVTIRFNPFQYNPVRNELRVVRRLRVEVYVAASGGVNVLPRGERVLAREFTRLYESMFLNFGAARYDSIAEYAGRMIIIAADAYLSNLEPFKEWKRQKGIDTKLIPISAVGNNPASIMDTIQAEYDAGGLVWVLLVGDGNEVVPAIGTVGLATGQDADPVYAYTSGSDYYPDIFVSRFSSRSGNSLNIDKQVVRSIEYEKNPMVGADWYHIGLGVASAQGSPADSTRCNWLRDSLLDYTYTEVNKSYDYWGTSALIKQYIEEGTGIINYIGHGGTTAWNNGGGFTVSDINQLDNPWLLPFVISVACLVGNFNGADCYCEASVTAGEVSQPDGFLVHWGSTINQSWVPPCYGQEGAVNTLTHDYRNTAGGIFFNGACYMIEHYASGSDGVEMAQTWCIFGDASVQLRTDTPQPITVNHAAAINLGQLTFDVNVPGVSDALVGLYVDTLLIGHGYTDGAGNVTIDLDPAPMIPGTMYITVTAYNKIPYLGSIPIVTPSGPYLIMASTILTAGTNGQANPGETVELGVWAKNIGVNPAYSVYGLLFESDPYVTLDIDSSWYGNIPVGDSALSNPDYEFTIANNCPNGHSIELTVEFHDSNDSIWISSTSVLVYAPELICEDYTIIDANGILEPGETADMVVTLGNEGGAEAENVTATLTTASSLITINDNSGTFGSIPAGNSGDNASDPFNVTASPSAAYGITVDCDLIVEAGLYVDTLDFLLAIGEPVPSDTGCYYTYYSGGLHTYAPSFDWFEIAPPGPGTIIAEITDEDADTVTVTLPFTFKFYGTDYNSIGICSNGFMEMGYSTHRFGANTGIPSAGGPRAMIAPFWDDLDPSLYGDIYQYHDAANHRWLVEFYDVAHYGASGQRQTFQVILLDPLYYPTPTGDGEILVQYLNGMAQTDGTFGIENYAEDVGIQYYFDGLYHEWAAEVTDSTALLYTTYPPDYVGIEESEELVGVPVRTMLGMVYPNPFARELSISYQLASSGRVSLRVYDALGREVRGLAQGITEPGYYTVHWDGRDGQGRQVPAGVYFVKFEADNCQSVQKTVLLK